MDDLDRKILALLAKNARMPVKEIAEQVALTSPAVSSRIHKLETDGIIGGYTVTLNRPADRVYVDALISLSVAPSKHEAFLHLIQNSKEVLQWSAVKSCATFSSSAAATARAASVTTSPISPPACRKTA